MWQAVSFHWLPGLPLILDHINSDHMNCIIFPVFITQSLAVPIYFLLCSLFLNSLLRSFFWAQHFQEWFCCCCWSFCFSQDGYNFKKSSPNSGAPGFLPVSFELVFMKSVRSVSRIPPLPFFAYAYPGHHFFFLHVVYEYQEELLNLS